MREKMNIDSTALDLGCCSCVTSVFCIGFEKREEVITEIHLPPSIFDTGCRNRIVCSALQKRTFELNLRVHFNSSGDNPVDLQEQQCALFLA